MTLIYKQTEKIRKSKKFVAPESDKEKVIKDKERILIVDDNEGSRKTLSLIFNKKGFKTKTAGTGKEALRLVRKEHFNVIILDIKLPDIEGIDLIYPLKELNSDIEIIMITAYGTLETAVRALNEGASAFINKPLNIDEVTAIIGKVLERQRLITEKRLAEQKLMQAYSEISQIFNITVPLCVIDRNYNIIRVNDTFSSSIKMKKSDTINRKCYDVIPGNHCHTSQCTMRQILNGRDFYEYEKDIEIENEKMITCIVRAVPYKAHDGEIKGLLESYTDITVRKLAENKLIESEEKYRNAYDRISFYKDIFTHDINNVFQNLLLSIELFSLYNKEPQKTEKLDETIHIFEDQVNNAIKLVSNVRKLSDIEDKEMPIKRIEVYQLLTSAINSISQRYKNKKISIKLNSYSKEIYVKANELLLDIFENILINTIKHNTNPLVEVLIRIPKEQQYPENFIRFEFIDNGIGISDVMKEKIFLGGYREDKNVSGMGLGLSLVKKIITNYNGQIWVEDRVKGDHTKGSNFIILIPIAI